MSITITAKALREALEFCNPDGPQDADQMETEVTIWMREKDEVATDGEPMPRGLYCHLSEYPEEGCIPLFEVTANVKVTIVPEGWQLVPTIPTAEMLKTFAMETPEPVFVDRYAVHRVYGWAAIDKIYRAMIAVAPKPPNVVIQGPPIGGPAGMESSTT